MQNIRVQAQLPNLLIIGAQKCGTTWVHRLLAQDERIFMSQPKELFFFSDIRKVKAGLEGYQYHFRDSKDAIYRGESSTNYFWVPSRPEAPMIGGINNRDIASSLRDHLGSEIKMIICLRHPVARAVSAYYHHYRKGRLRDEPSVIKAMMRPLIAELGNYAHHYAHFLHTFSKAQFHVIFLDEIRQYPRRVAQSIYDFLSLSPPSLQLLRPQNKGFHYHVKGDTISANKHLLAQYNFWSTSGGPPSIHREDLMKLFDYYLADLDRLESHFPEKVDQWIHIGEHDIMGVMAH